MSKDIKDVKLADLLPDSISGDEGVQAVAGSIDPQLQAVSDALNAPLVLPALDDLATGILDHLAAQYDVTAWDTAWDKAQKISALHAAIQDKRKKGTRGAVQRAIEVVAPIAQISEWWEQTPEGTPHTFRVDVMQDGEAVPAQTQSDVLAQIEEAKPVRSHLEAFTIGQKAGAGIYMSGIARAISYARVTSTGTVEESGSIQAGMAVYARAFNVRHLVTEGIMGELPEPAVIAKKAFGRSAAYQTANSNLASSSSAYLYGEGETAYVYSGTQVPITIRAAYLANGSAVSINALRLYWDAYNDGYALRVRNGSTSRITYCYLEYVPSNTRAFGQSRNMQYAPKTVANHGFANLYAAACSTVITVQAGDAFEIVAAYDTADNRITVPSGVSVAGIPAGADRVLALMNESGADFTFNYIEYRKI